MTNGPKVNGTRSTYRAIRRRTTKNMNAEQQQLKRPDGAGNFVEDDKEPSPFKIYEDKYCSRCQDYHGCIGLIDNLTLKMQDPARLDGLPKEMAQVMNHLNTSLGMGSGQRFQLIATCMGARNYMRNYDKKSTGRKRKKLSGGV